MAGGVYDSLNIEQKQLKMPEIKFLILVLFLTKYGMSELYHVKGVLGDFSIKSKSFYMFVVVFLFI
jgi:hypothetical protein